MLVKKDTNDMNKEILLDAYYSALDLIKNELGEGEVTEKLRDGIKILENKLILENGEMNETE